MIRLRFHQSPNLWKGALALEKIMRVLFPSAMWMPALKTLGRPTAASARVGPVSGRICALTIAAASLAIPEPAAAQAEDWRAAPMELRLIDGLDRPEDGYCLDIIGSGSAIRLDMPLAAHNCVPGFYPDRIVALRQDGTIHFPAFEGCATVMGLNDRALPGAALMIKPCGQDTPFLEARRFQDFEHQRDGRVVLAGTTLCVVVGDESHTTYSRTHRWRTLFVDTCDDVPMNRSAWRIAAAN